MKDQVESVGSSDQVALDPIRSDWIVVGWVTSDLIGSIQVRWIRLERIRFHYLDGLAQVLRRPLRFGAERAAYLVFTLTNIVTLGI